MRTILLPVLTLLSLLPCVLSARTGEPTGQPGDITGSDPLVLRSRLEVSNTFIRPEAGDFNNILLFRGNYAPGGGVLAGLDIPLVRVDTGSAERTGLGDLQLRTLGLLISTRYVAAAAGVNLIFPTATERVAGSGKLQVAPLAGGSLSLSPQAKLFVLFQQFLSAGGFDDRRDINELSTRYGFLYAWKSGWWALVSPEIRLDFEDENAGTLTTDLEVGKRLGAHSTVFFSPGVHLAGEQRIEYGLRAGYRYLFAPPE